jgi:serine/threonine protein kinase
MSDSGRQRSPVAPGAIVAGKYRVERVLGAGGMGIVVAATHIELAQPVALKFIQPSAVANAGSLERFMREARAAVRLRSEHVCRVLDVGRDDDRPYMVLELLEGMDLATLARQSAPLPVADAVEYVLQACDALVEAHALGIVHRDLKPQNIFITRRVNGTPLVKVLDFGIAKSVGAAAAGQLALTDSSAIIGSPLYMAPEQMRAPKTVDVRIDVWGLGVILYELLGGQLPFDGDTVTEVCIKVVNEEPTRLLDLRPALDRKLVDVVMRALEKDPDDRWQNVAQLAVELEPFSRSGRQGSFTRPWRSFEDTSQPQDALPRVVLSTGGTPSDPDNTGPSTALTMPSAGAPPLIPSSRHAEGGAPSPGLAATTPMPGVAGPRGARVPSELPDVTPPLTSTDTAWGEGTPPQTAQPRQAPARTMVLPIAGAIALAASVAVFVTLRGGAPARTHDAPATSSAAVAVAALPPPALPPESPPVPASPALRAPAPTAPLASTPSPAARPMPPTRAGRLADPGARAAAGTAAATSTSRHVPVDVAEAPPSRPVDPPPRPLGRTSDPTSAPNGAPILH